MRLWHKSLISVLPRKQLLGQWRECCLIAKGIKENGTPNHLLVNKVTNYPPGYFLGYCRAIYSEMINRKYTVSWDKLTQYFADDVEPENLSLIGKRLLPRKRS